METIFKRRSVRKYTDTAVSDEQLKQIIKAGMAAPSAKNSQEWIFIVLRDPAIYQKFSEVHVNAFAMKTAQAAILVCADLSKEKDPGQGWWIQDCAAAMENMLLEATDLGGLIVARRASEGRPDRLHERRLQPAGRCGTAGNYGSGRTDKVPGSHRPVSGRSGILKYLRKCMGKVEGQEWKVRLTEKKLWIY